jgi:hypothetical protein
MSRAQIRFFCVSIDVLDGGFALPVQGQATRPLKPGDGLQVAPETPPTGGKPGDTETKLAITSVVQKGRPLVSPAGAGLLGCATGPRAAYFSGSSLVDGPVPTKYRMVPSSLVMP